MSIYRLLGVLLCVVLLCVAVDLPSVWAQEDAKKKLNDALAKAKELDEQAKYQEAAKLLESALELAHKAYGTQHEHTAEILYYIGDLYYKLNQCDKAESCMLSCLKIMEAKLGKDHVDTASIVQGLGSVYWRKGDYPKAERYLQHSLQILEDKLGKNHSDVADSLNLLAEFHLVMAEYGKAEASFQRALKIRESQADKDDLKLAVSLQGLADVYRATMRLNQAEPLYLRSLKIREMKLGKNHSDVATCKHMLANLYTALGLFEKAEPLLKQSILIYKERNGKNDSSVADGLNDLGAMYKAMRNFEKAGPLFEQSIKILETKFGKNHPTLKNGLMNLGEVYQQTNQFDKSEAILLRCLKIQETHHGKNHPNVTGSMLALANLYAVMPRPDKAEELYLRSLNVMESEFGKDSPQLILFLYNLKNLYWSWNRLEKAAEYTDRERRITLRHLSFTLQGLAEKDQLAFLNQFQLSTHVSLLIGLEQLDNAMIANRSASWLLNSKALLQQVLAERFLQARERRADKAGQLHQQLLQVRKQLASLTFASDRTKPELDRNQKIQNLQAQEEELSKQLGQIIGRSTNQNPWVELSSVQKALPDESVLIELKKFEIGFTITPQGGKRKTIKPCYAAWLIPPAGRGEVRLIDLGAADKIEAAVQAVRSALRESQNPDRSKNPILQKGEPEAEKELRKPLAELSKLVLEPLLEHIGPKQHWLISPDAALWLVPWAALPLQDGSYAIEKYRISYLVSGRDLVTPPAKTTPGRSMIVADPDYDLGLAAARAAARALLNNPETVAELRGVTSSSKLPQVARLPGTAAEAAAIKPKLARFAGVEPWVYKDKNAQEAVFKSFKSPKVLVLSTHGFFLEDQQLAAPDQNLPSGRREPAERPAKSPLLTKDGKLFENPLVRCGLLLAGCNDREGGRAENDEDGVLTGLEIVGTDLRGTELVVLSACETGLGQVRNGEGVAGLRQAFQLAGARAVVATLWQIPDRDSALLMSEFFENLAAGKSNSDALREAQLARIKARRERHGAAHPFFWAAFTLTGQ